MATMRDVARECGVSVATVSYVLNEASVPVRAQTRRKVLEAARRLNYQPNGTARALVRRRMHVIGVHLHVSAAGLAMHPFSCGILQGILDEAGKTDYDVLTYANPWPGLHGAAAVRDRRADGILVSLLSARKVLSLSRHVTISPAYPGPSGRCGDALPSFLYRRTSFASQRRGGGTTTRP
jgi:DNA-binding LacI/PurR family transcriptional regulator